jgi:hypothetical protein
MTACTELFLTCDLKPGTPKQIIDTLNSLTRKEDSSPDNPPPNSFYLALHGTSLEPVKEYKLTIRGELNTEHEIFLSFLEWLAPYVDTPIYGGFAGYYNIINGKEKITNWIYFKDKEFHLLEVANPFSQYLLNRWG